MNENVLQVVTWRENGDDEDSTLIHVGKEEPIFDLICDWLGEQRSTIREDEDGECWIGEHLIYSNTSELFKSGERRDCNGRQFRITIDEIDVCIAGSPAVNGQCGDPDCVCAPEGDEYAADDTSRDALLDRLGKAVANLHDEDLLKLIERIAI